MKRYLVHVVYLLLIAFFVVYGRIMAKESQKMATSADIVISEAEANLQYAERMAELAENEAVMARRAENKINVLMKELENCKSSKK